MKTLIHDSFDSNMLERNDFISQSRGGGMFGSNKIDGGRGWRRCDGPKCETTIVRKPAGREILASIGRRIAAEILRTGHKMTKKMAVVRIK